MTSTRNSTNYMLTVLDDKLRLYGVVSGSGDEFDVALIPYTDDTLNYSLVLASEIATLCDKQFQSWFDAPDKRDAPLPPYLEYWEGCDLYVELPNGDLYTTRDPEGDATHGWRLVWQGEGQ